MASESTVVAWRPGVPGIVEVYHAGFRQHVYPVHAHSVWTLVILDEGELHFNQDRHEHTCLPSQVLLLPPHVPHGGRAPAPQGLRKRVLYLTEDAFDADLIGAAVDRPVVADPQLWDRVGRLHDTLDKPGDAFEAQGRLALILERLGKRLQPGLTRKVTQQDQGLAEQLHDLLNERLATGLTLDEAARLLHAHPTHLIRVFTRRFAIPPHLYLTGRRVELARQLLLSGWPVGAVATEVGFYDQSHLTRHFKRLLGVSPARFARGR